RALASREATEAFTLTGRIVAPDFVERFGEQRGKLYLFGAGHVGQALITALTPLIDAPLTTAPLPLDVIWVDSRADSFPAVLPSHVLSVLSDDPLPLVAAAEPGGFVLIMTHSHALDYDLTAAALGHPALNYIGLIGSATKRARFVRRLRDAGMAPGRIADLVCPIGLTTIRSKHPAAIAAAITAQLLVRTEEVLAQAAPGDNLVDAAGHLRSRRGRDGNVTETCCGQTGLATGTDAGRIASTCAGCQHPASAEATSSVNPPSVKARDPGE
ncbi:MAG TPA: XdhC family protein, partial [Dongiaceae bacterium]